MREKILFGIIACVLFSVESLYAERPKELGVVDYFAQYKWSKPSHTARYAKEGNTFVAKLAEMEMKPEKVSPEIFNADQKERRDQFKRIFIPWFCYVFSMEQYQGMEDYVKSGGFLVTSSGLSLVDSDNDKTFGKDKETTFPTKTFLGLKADWVFNIKKIKVVDPDNALLENVNIKGWTPLVVGGRKGRNVSAEVLIESEGLIYKKKHKAAFLAVKSYGKGACVFIAAPLSRPNAMKNNPLLLKIAINSLQSKAFKDYCLQ